MVRPGPSGRRHLVLVEPDGKVREALVSALAEEGYACHPHEGGDAALVTLRNLVPHLVVTRLAMRGVDGLQLCKNIRDRRLLDGVPVVVINDPPDSGAATAVRRLAGVHVVGSAEEAVETARRLLRIGRETEDRSA